MRPRLSEFLTILIVLASSSAFSADSSASVPLSSRVPETIQQVLQELATTDSRIARADWRLESVRHGLTATHYRFSQWIGTQPVIGGEVVVSVGPDGAIIRRHVTVATEAIPRPRRSLLLDDLRRRNPEIDGPVAERSSAFRHRDGVAVPIDRLVVEDGPYRFTVWEIDAASGEVLSKTPEYASVSGRVFPSNPVTSLNDPSLRDGGDAAGVIPEAAYAIEELESVPDAGELTGPYVRIVDIDSPFTTRARVEEGLLFERDSDQFEEVNAYHHIDRSQRYLQGLGYTGLREIVPGGVRVDVHANRGADNSFFSATSNGPTILFGDGGVDDAEDPDIILHEYAHAIHDSLSPGVLFGTTSSEARAMSEGFGDYWAFSSGFDASVASGRDPYCVGDWDARCDGPQCAYPPSADCLRRVDEELTRSDFIFSSAPGTEHENGRIWASYLRDVFMHLVARHGPEEGRQRADTLVLEAFQGLPSNPGFDLVVNRMIEADAPLYGSADHKTLCVAARARALGVPASCRESQRGQTLIVPGGDSLVLQPGTRVERHVTLSSDALIRDLLIRIELDTEAPTSLEIGLRRPGGDRVILKSFGETAPATVTFGRDRLPSGLLDGFLGEPSPGVWTLELELLANTDPVSLRDWALLFDLDVSEKVDVRAPVSGARFLPAVANTPGALGTFFVSDLAITNPGGAHEVTLIFTPSGQDGTASFGAVKAFLPANGSIVLNDVVRSAFDAAGSGSLEIRGARPEVRVSSRTYNLAPGGTFGQTIPLARELILPGRDAYLSQIRRSERYRTNIGLVDLSGRGSEAILTVRDRDGEVAGIATVGLEPFTLRQLSLASIASVLELDSAWAEVRVVGADDAIAAYSSLVDNLTGDSVFVPAAVAPVADRPLAVPVAARVPGARDTRWRTDLWMVNGGESAEAVRLRFHRADGQVFENELELPPRSSRLFEDVVASVFGIEGSGWIELSPSSLVVTSRTWNDDPEGSYGQYIGTVEQDQAIGPGSSSIVPKVIMSIDFRSNVGMTEIAGAPAAVRIDVRDGEGMLRCSQPVVLEAHQHRQWSIAELGCAQIGGGRVEFHHLQGAGRIAGYVSIVDQKSGDPSYIPAD